MSAYEVSEGQSGKGSGSEDEVDGCDSKTHFILLLCGLLFGFLQLFLYPFSAVSRVWAIKSSTTHISFLMNSRRFSTFTFASFESCGTREGPMSL